LKGKKKIKSQEMFAGFSVAAGDDRFSEHIKLNGHSTNDCKVSAQDTAGASCVFEFNGKSGGPRHLHPEQDEWIYVLAGEFDFQVGEKRFRVGPGESGFLPRKVAHVWACVNERPGKIINMHQPRGKMEEFFREVGKFDGKPNIYEVLSLDQFQQLFRAHGMDLSGPPLIGEWLLDEKGRIARAA
jgi:quercetin 2,3-dioxygenase